MEFVVLSAEVAEAQAAGRGIVALESTLIAHGLPYPENLEVGRALEAAVRHAGAVPATIAIVDGVARVGLEDEVLQRLAEDGTLFSKAGALDLPVALARRGCAATTVSATSVIAYRAGISVFATGGIGGVHRGDAGDVSSDLSTLASTPIAVVSAGAKAILDLPRTLELLETLGVLVVGFRTEEFPAFYTRSSGLTLDHCCDDLEELARIVATRFALAQGGVLIANPIPAEAALEPTEVEEAIEAALAGAAAASISGKEVTPYLLSRLATVTAGRSIEANRALAVANAALAGELAVALAEK